MSKKNPNPLEYLTLERLKALLHYDAETGVFSWRNSRHGCPGNRRAGSIDAATGYRRITVDGWQVGEHRLAVFYMTGAWPLSQVDHENKRRDDNRWLNLRPAPEGLNQQNSGMYRTNTSGIKGAFWDKKNGKWRSAIHAEGKRHWLGSFATAEEAGAAYRQARDRLHPFFSHA